MQKNFEQHQDGNKQANGPWHDYAKYGNGVRKRNSNVVKR